MDKTKIFDIVEEARKELCTDEGGFEEFERGVRIVCNNIRLKLRDVLSEQGVK